MAQFPKIENEKPDFSPTFQKVELHNSTFIQQLKIFLINRDRYGANSLESE